MRLIEIRCTDPVGKAGTTANGDRNILLKRGTTVLYFDVVNTDPLPNISIQSSLCTRNTLLSDHDKKKFFQAFYEDGLAAMPDSFERKLAAFTSVPGLSFLFADEVTQKLLRGNISDDDRRKFILAGAVGAESNLLAQRLDWQLLLDDSVDVVNQRYHFLQLKERLELSRIQLAEPARSKLYHTRSELLSVLQDPALKVSHSVSDVSVTAEIRNLEGQLQNLKEKDEELREEQRTLMLLSIKNDYESLLKLRRELEDLESNASHYAGTITGQGRDITVHELTMLSGLHQEFREKEGKIEAEREEVKKIQEERYQWEQKRILSEYKVKQLQEKLAQTQAEQDDITPDKFEDSNKLRGSGFAGQEEDKTIGLKHILLLGGLALALLALLLFNNSQITAIICLGLAGITLVVALILFLRPAFNRKNQLNENLAESLRRPTILKSDNLLTEQLAEQTEIWRSSLAEADQLAASVNRRLIALRSLDESQRRSGNELLKQLSFYADIEKLEDAEHVLEALRNQRQSESSYDESVSEYLRQIADVRKGRTDEDMLREYEHACEELYGATLTGDGSGYQNFNLRSQALNYDKNRARRIEIERVELSQDISRHKQRLKEMKASQVIEEEFLAQTPKLRRRRDLLEQKLWQELEDMLELDLAITMLDFLYTEWKDLPLDYLRTLTLNYSRRLQGMQAVDNEVDDHLIEEQRGIRKGQLYKFVPEKNREKELSLIDNSPSDIIYLAFRMALLDLQANDGQGPLLIFDLPLFNTSIRINELLNLLDERMLELSAQSIFLTSNSLLMEIAGQRQIPVHILT